MAVGSGVKPTTVSDCNLSIYGLISAVVARNSSLPRLVIEIPICRLSSKEALLY